MIASSLRIVLIVVVAAAAGYLRARELPWIPDIEAIKQADEQHTRIRANAGVTLEELLELIDQGAVVIDARTADAFEKGHLATDGYPPVINVPPDDVHNQIDRLMQLQGYPLVLYCTSNTCEFGEDLYIELERYGFVDIKIYFPGWEGITELGLPTATGPDTWTGFEDEPDGTAQDEFESEGDEGVPEPNLPDEIEP